MHGDGLEALNLEMRKIGSACNNFRGLQVTGKSPSTDHDPIGDYPVQELQ